ncbi:MAG: fimbrillin family protein, partial [Bacteroidetes bacterium]|nr:fimbrillin family protein [Bacteroidota bacterium]
MVSALLNKTKPANDEKITLDFKHILSQINFTLKGEAADFKYTVTKIEIVNANYIGDFTFDGTVNIGAWDNYEFIGDYAIDLTENNVVEGIRSLRVENNIMMLLPQTLPADAKIKVTYSVMQGDRTSKIFDGSKEISLANKVWVKNTRTRYTLTLPVGGDKMTFDTNVSDWEAENPEVLSILELNKSTMNLNHKFNEEETLVATLIPEDTGASYEWESSDETVATVDVNGKVKALEDGNVTITVKSKGQSASCEVTVVDPIIEEITGGFKVFLLQYPGINTLDDGEIRLSEAVLFTDPLNLQTGTMSDIKGIEYFKNIKSLDMGQFGLREDKMSSCGLSLNTKLETLICSTILEIENFDLTPNTALKTLDCSFSNIVKSIDISMCKGLENFNCQLCGDLETVYVWEGFDINNYPNFTNSGNFNYVVK